MRTEVVHVARPGGPERLVLRSASVDAPGPGAIRVSVEAAGVAFADIMVREGRYPNVRAPVVPGYDLVGRVDAVGEGVTDFAPGGRVAALTVTGAYARHIIVPARWAVAAPESLDSATAVSLVLNYVTAWQMLRRTTTLASGDIALVHGAAGGVGTALLELCRLHGIRAYGTASRGKHDVVTRLGATPIDYTRDDFVHVVQQAGGVDAAFDHVGGAHLARSYAALRATGVLVSYGAMSAFPNGRSRITSALALLAREPRFKPLGLLSANKAVVGFDIAGRRDARPDWFASDLTRLFELASAGEVKPIVAARFPLAQAADAQVYLANRSVVGKVVLDMSAS